MDVRFPGAIPRERRTWQQLGADPAFGATKERVFGLVREEVGEGEERER